MKKKYEPKLFPIPRFGLKKRSKWKLRWIWGGEKYGYCRVSDWPNKVGNPKKTDWIFPRGDMVKVIEVGETKGPEKEKYSRVLNLYRGKSGWVQTKDLIDQNPLDMLGNWLEGKAETPLEKKLDDKTCTNGACAIQNWLRAYAMKHVSEIALASDLRKDGDKTQKYIKYYKNKAGKRIIDLNKAPVWPGDLVIFGNPKNAKYNSKYLHTNVLKDPNLKIKKIDWSGHTGTIAMLDLEKDTLIKGINLIEAHLPGKETKGTKYTLDDIHYWGVINWGFVATTERSTNITDWNKLWKDWWFYHRILYLLLAKKMKGHGEEDWWYYKELKKTHSSEQIEKKAKEESKLATDLLAKECKNRGRPPITIERVFTTDKDKALKEKYSFLDVYGFAYWVEPKSPS